MNIIRRHRNSIIAWTAAAVVGIGLLATSKVQATNDGKFRPIVQEVNADGVYVARMIDPQFRVVCYASGRGVGCVRY